MITYKIKENKAAPEQTIIEKTGETIEITLADTLDSIDQNNRSMQELEANISLKKAVIDNVSKNHPKVLDLDEKSLIAAAIYYESQKYITFANGKVEEIKAANGRLQNEVEEIEKQTGVKGISTEAKKEIAKSIKNKIEKGEITVESLKENKK